MFTFWVPDPKFFSNCVYPVVMIENVGSTGTPSAGWFYYGSHMNLDFPKVYFEEVEGNIIYWIIRLSFEIIIQKKFLEKNSVLLEN